MAGNGDHYLDGGLAAAGAGMRPQKNGDDVSIVTAKRFTPLSQLFFSMVAA